MLVKLLEDTVLTIYSYDESGYGGSYWTNLFEKGTVFDVWDIGYEYLAETTTSTIYIPKLVAEEIPND